jgi:DNA-binding transcriptional ArsR family regulator
MMLTAFFDGLKLAMFPSQHLRVLRDAGLVDVRVDGPRRLYRANADGIARLRAELDAFWRPSLRALKRTAERESAS